MPLNQQQQQMLFQQQQQQQQMAAAMGGAQMPLYQQQPTTAQHPNMLLGLQQQHLHQLQQSPIDPSSGLFVGGAAGPGGMGPGVGIGTALSSEHVLVSEATNSNANTSIAHSPTGSYAALGAAGGGSNPNFAFNPAAGNSSHNFGAHGSAHGSSPNFAFGGSNPNFNAPHGHRGSSPTFAPTAHLQMLHAQQQQQQQQAAMMAAAAAGGGAMQQQQQQPQQQQKVRNAAGGYDSDGDGKLNTANDERYSPDPSAFVVTGGPASSSGGMPQQQSQGFLPTVGSRGDLSGMAFAGSNSNTSHLLVPPQQQQQQGGGLPRSGSYSQLRASPSNPQIASPTGVYPRSHGSSNASPVAGSVFPVGGGSVAAQHHSSVNSLTATPLPAGLGGPAAAAGGMGYPMHHNNNTIMNTSTQQQHQHQQQGITAGLLQQQQAIHQQQQQLYLATAIIPASYHHHHHLPPPQANASSNALASFGGHASSGHTLSNPTAAGTNTSSSNMNTSGAIGGGGGSAPSPTVQHQQMGGAPASSTNMMMPPLHRGPNSGRGAALSAQLFAATNGAGGSVVSSASAFAGLSHHAHHSQSNYLLPPQHQFNSNATMGTDYRSISASNDNASGLDVSPFASREVFMSSNPNFGVVTGSSNMFMVNNSQPGSAMHSMRGGSQQQQQQHYAMMAGMGMGMGQHNPMGMMMGGHQQQQFQHQQHQQQQQQMQMGGGLGMGSGRNLSGGHSGPASQERFSGPNFAGHQRGGLPHTGTAEDEDGFVFVSAQDFAPDGSSGSPSGSSGNLNKRGGGSGKKGDGGKSASTSILNFSSIKQAIVNRARNGSTAPNASNSKNASTSGKAVPSPSYNQSKGGSPTANGSVAGSSRAGAADGSAVPSTTATVGRGGVVKTKVLEAYRAASEAERQRYTLEMLLGHVVPFAVDSEGSRGLQRLLTEAFVSVWNHFEKNGVKGKGNTKTSQTRKQSLPELAATAPRAAAHQQPAILATLREVFIELEQSMIPMVFDAYANYVVQRFIETQAAEFLRPMIAKCRAHSMYELSRNDYGCRVVQNLLEASAATVTVTDNANADAMAREAAKTEASIEREAAALVAQLDKSPAEVRSLIRDRNGNHVIQKCLMFYPQECAFIGRAIAEEFMDLAMNVYGCRVIQCVFEQLKGPSVGFESAHAAYVLMLLAMDHCQELANSQYGNFVVTHALINSPEPTNCPADAATDGSPNERWSRNSRMSVSSAMLRYYSANSRMGQSAVGFSANSRCASAPGPHDADELTTPLNSAINRLSNSSGLSGLLSADRAGIVDSAALVGPASPTNTFKDEYIDPNTVRRTIVDRLMPHLLELSCSKFASNVAQRLFAFADEEQKGLMVEMLTVEPEPSTEEPKPSSSSSPADASATEKSADAADANVNPSAADPANNTSQPLIVRMMTDQYANYVIQRVLDECADGPLKEQMMAVAEANSDFISQSPYGRHIITRLFPPAPLPDGSMPAPPAPLPSAADGKKGGKGKGGKDRRGGQADASSSSSPQQHTDPNAASVGDSAADSSASTVPQAVNRRTATVQRTAGGPPTLASQHQPYGSASAVHYM